MPAFAIPNTAVISAFNELGNLQRWLRPGMLAYIVAQHFDQLRPAALQLFAQRQSMIEEAGMREPDTLPDGSTNPKAGQLIVRYEPGVGTVTKYRTPEAGAEFERRDAELMGGTTTLTVDKRLTLAWVERLESERLVEPRTQPGAVEQPETRGVDFVALFPLIDRAVYDSNGVAVPPVPATSPAGANGTAGKLAAVP